MGAQSCLGVDLGGLASGDWRGQAEYKTTWNLYDSIVLLSCDIEFNTLPRPWMIGQI